MKQQIFYETLRRGLVAVEFVGWEPKALMNAHRPVLRVTRAHPLYNVGDVIKCDAQAVVIKMGRGLVAQAILPVRTDDNTLPTGYF